MDFVDGKMGNKFTSPDDYILTRDFSDENGNKYWAKFNYKPFDEGVSRWAFKGTIRGSGPKKDKSCVVKVFKEEYAKQFEDWVPDLYTSLRAKDLAKIFNDDVLPKLVLKKPVKMEFVVPTLAKVDESTMVSKNQRKTKRIEEKEYVAIEEFIDGNYVKFNSNGGYEDLQLSDIMPAFTHWTWEYSENKLMVCDLQGVKKCEPDCDRYILTDPAIHSLEETFGLTDLGVAGMYRILMTHTCTDACQQLGLTNPIKDTMSLIFRGEPRETTYRTVLTDSERQMNAMERRP